ncbi:hisS, partial [Symbiodinium natans]
VEHFDNSQEAICQRLDFAQQAQLQTLNSSQVLLHKIDSAQEDVVNKVTEQKHLVERVKSGQELILETLTGSSDSAKKDLLDSMENSSKALLRKLDTSQQELLTKQGEQHEILVSVNKSQGTLMQKIDTGNEAAARRAVEQDSHVERKMTEMRKEVVSTCDNAVSQISKNITSEMHKLGSQNTSTTELFQNGMASQEERMADVRRQNMMIMDMLSGTQERVMQSAENIQSFTRLDLAASYQLDQAKLEVEMRNVVANEMAHMRSELETIMLGSDGHEAGFSGNEFDQHLADTALAGELADASARLEAQYRRIHTREVQALEMRQQQLPFTPPPRPPPRDPEQGAPLPGADTWEI